VSKTRAIRFSEQEEKQIEEFLGSNPFFDFSTLARMAILAFIKAPKMSLKPIRDSHRAKLEKRPHGQS
jgi:hypothetical protein